MRAVWVVEAIESGYESESWVVRGYERKRDAEQAKDDLTAQLARLKSRVEKIRERDGDAADWDAINKMQARGLPGDRHTSFDMDRAYVVWSMAIVPAPAKKPAKKRSAP